MGTNTNKSVFSIMPRILYCNYLILIKKPFKQCFSVLGKNFFFFFLLSVTCWAKLSLSSNLSVFTQCSLHLPSFLPSSPSSAPPPPPPLSPNFLSLSVPAKDTVRSWQAKIFPRSGPPKKTSFRGWEEISGLTLAAWKMSWIPKWRLRREQYLKKTLDRNTKEVQNFKVGWRKTFWFFDSKGAMSSEISSPQFNPRTRKVDSN